MITTQEKSNIILGFKNIQESIRRILTMLQKYKSNIEIINELIKNNPSQTNITDNIKTFLSKEKDLISLYENFSNFPEIEDSISRQYKTFLQTEIIKFNPESLQDLSSSTQNSIYEFLNKQSESQLNITPSDKHTLFLIGSIPRIYTSHINSLLDIQSKLYIFNQIKTIQGSIVMIGANGSGKSTFARQLSGKISNNISILSAQRFLYYKNKNTISATGDEIEKVRAFQLNTKLGDDNNFQQLITSDMNYLIDALTSQHTDCTYKHYNTGSYVPSHLSKTIQIWDSIIEHRNLVIERTGLYVKRENINTYDFNQLSDGEKAVFYYIGHILLAPDNSYIIIDEPENHLNINICNKLWDELERERSDCKFIYLTHNLDFATTRSDCTILWNKKYIPPYKWDFEVLPKTEIIPEVLVMELVGSRKNICFCEGDNKSSLDYKLYSILFPQYTVIPVSGHKNVIDYVNTYNNTTAFTTKAVGIIDGDHHLPQQIKKWKNNNIFTLPINEIENILCDEYILNKAIDIFCTEEGMLTKYKDNFWKVLNENIEKQATSYVNEYINNLFKDNFLHETKNINFLINELQNITSEEEIKNLYEETKNKLHMFIQNKDYNSALKFINFKGRLTKDIAKKTIVDNYENRILGLIKKNQDLQNYIINIYFKEFNF